MTAKGILLAGGAGTRLHPITLGVSKQLLPVFDKPMIYYPLSTLMLAGIRDVLVITTPVTQAQFQRLLGDGGQWGLNIQYATQAEPKGIAQAFIIGEDFIANDRCTLILGDNIFYGHGLGESLQKAGRSGDGAVVFAYKVRDPERYGIVEFDARMRPIGIVEKPTRAKSPYAVTGLYFYDNEVVQMAKDALPSKRGELEISDINHRYIERGRLSVERLGRGHAWFDAGTAESLLDAAEFIRTVEKRQGMKIACLEEIALALGFIDRNAFSAIADNMRNTEYGVYLRTVLAESS